MNQTSTLHSSATGRAVASIRTAAPTDRLLLTAHEAADVLGVSVRLFHSLRPGLPLPVVLAKRAVRWRRSDLARHIEGLHAATEARPEPSQLAVGKATKAAEKAAETARRAGLAGGSVAECQTLTAESEAQSGSQRNKVPSNPKTEAAE